MKRIITIVLLLSTQLFFAGEDQKIFTFQVSDRIKQQFPYMQNVELTFNENVKMVTVEDLKNNLAQNEFFKETGMDINCIRFIYGGAPLKENKSYHIQSDDVMRSTIVCTLVQNNKEQPNIINESNSNNKLLYLYLIGAFGLGTLFGCYAHDYYLSRNSNNSDLKNNER